jgi:cytoskeletal protein CcmA (bactofilin family)
VLEARKRVEIKSPGRVYGEIRTPNLIIGDGALFEGTCVMKKGGMDKGEVVVEYKGEDKPAGAEREGSQQKNL